MFDIQPGDTLILLGDTKRGLAIIGGNKMNTLAEKMLDSIVGSENEKKVEHEEKTEHELGEGIDEDSCHYRNCHGSDCGGNYRNACYLHTQQPTF
jgi:hypothetical protein